MNNFCSPLLKDGLGNLMFQISNCLSYSIKSKKELIFFENLYCESSHGNISKYKNNFLKNVKLNSFPKNYNNFKIYKEKKFEFSEIPKIDTNVVFDGYFQSYKYFEDHNSLILDFLGINNLRFKKNTCGIHVRRGDFLLIPDYHPVQNLDYYIKAINNFNKKTKFIVFSDDISWCVNNLSQGVFSNFDIDFSSNINDYDDFIDMSTCENIIMSNSSFSWWASWCNPNKNKKIICPNKWFGSAYSNYSTKDLIPKNWISI